MDVIGRLRREFFYCTRELLAYTPWFATMGNHDSPNEGYFNYFSFPEPRYWYSLNYGCAHVIVLNSNMDYRPGSEQWVWLEHDLRASRAAPWTFVFLHHPPFCSNSCQIAATRVLCSLFEEHDVDVVYSAHATLYERFHPLTAGAYDDQGGVVYIVTGGGGYDMDAPTSAFWDQIHPFSAMSRAMNHILLTTYMRCLAAISAIRSVVGPGMGSAQSASFSPFSPKFTPSTLQNSVRATRSGFA